MRPIPVTSADDPRIADYRDVRDRDLTGRKGLLMAEGTVVLNVLASSRSRCRPVSALIAAHRVESLRPVLERLDAPIYAADQGVMDAIAGFPIHRGVLALARRPEAPALDTLLSEAPAGAVVVAVCGVGNHDNMGGVFRNAAAFGAYGVLLDDRCCDPLYRKSIRVSVGAALRVPHTDGLATMAMLDALEAAGFEALALSPGAAERLVDVRPRGRTALILGAEGPGLDAEVIARCRPVAIPMADDFDSLNVATTSAVALHHLRFA